MLISTVSTIESAQLTLNVSGKKLSEVGFLPDIDQ